MKIASTVGVLRRSPRARGALLKFLSPVAKLALGLVVSLAVYGLLVVGLRWAGYDGAYDQTIGTWLTVGLLVFALYERVMSYKGPNGWG